MSDALFSDIHEACSQKICGGERNPSDIYAVNPLGSYNYGQFKKDFPDLANIDQNPSTVYLTDNGRTNYGQVKKA